MSRKLLCLLASAAVLLAAAAGRVAAAATTEEVLAKIVKAEEDTKTLEADIKLLYDEGDKHSEGTAHFVTQIVMKDGKPAGHLLNWKQDTKTDGGIETVLRVNDGDFLWTERNGPLTGGVMVTKEKPHEGGSEQLTGDMRQVRELFDMKLVGEEDFDGQKMWVFEGPFAENVKMAFGDDAKGKLFYGQKDLMLHRFAILGLGGKEMASAHFTNIKLNGQYDPALFKYTPPKGAEVIEIKNPPGGKDATKKDGKQDDK